MALFILVHGNSAWSPIQALLEIAGHRTMTPSLTGYGDRTHLAHAGLQLSDHVDDVVNPILEADLSGIVLVGHSYGGLVITGVAERIPDRLRHLVYVDALAPQDGESALDISAPERRAEILELARTQGGGVWVPSRNPRPGGPPGHPLATLTERVHLTNPLAAALPRTFIYCSNPPAPMIGLSAERARTDPRWTFHEFPVSHNIQRDAPHELTEILLGTV